MSGAQRLVQLAKWLIAGLLRITGVLAWLRARRARRGEIPVLWLHRVDGTPTARVPMGVPPEAFRVLVRELSRRYRIATWSRCVEAARIRDRRPHVAITFDDGYRDNAEVAWPILREAGGTAIFCLTTSFVDGTDPLWWEAVAARHAPDDGNERHPRKGSGEATYGAKADRTIAALKELPTREREARVRELASGAAPGVPVPAALSWEDARRMLDEGAEMAAHSVSHPILPRCTDEELERELAGGRRILGERLGREIALLAYPNGSFDDRVVESARRAGYAYAFTIEQGTYSAETDPMRIPRFGVSEPKYSLDGRRFSWTIFEGELLGIFDALLLRRHRLRR